ncbi:MAG: hypothetical protein AB1706_17125 [Pseudomonadota bacterium]
MAPKTQKKQPEPTLQQVAYKLPCGEEFEFKIKGKVYKIEITPMAFDSQLKFAQTFGVIAKEFIDDEISHTGEDLSLAKILSLVKKFLINGLDFKWLERLPVLTHIILKSYEDNDVKELTETDIKKIDTGKMIELILRQIETDRLSSEVANNFFMSIIKSLPGIDVINNLLSSTARIMEARSLETYISSQNLPNSGDAPQNT